MNENVASRWLPQPPRFGNIGSVWIGNAKREVKLAVRISAINEVQPFRRFAVTFDLFVAQGRETKVNVVIFQNLVIVQKVHPTRCLIDHNKRDLWPS